MRKTIKKPRLLFRGRTWIIWLKSTVIPANMGSLLASGLMSIGIILLIMAKKRAIPILVLRIMRGKDHYPSESQLLWVPLSGLIRMSSNLLLTSIHQAINSCGLSMGENITILIREHLECFQYLRIFSRTLNFLRTQYLATHRRL